MGGEVQLAAGLHEIDVALALSDDVAALLPRGLVEVGHVPRMAGRGIEDEHLPGHVVPLGAEHVVDAPVAGGADPVVGVVGVGKAGVVDARDQARRRRGRRLAAGADHRRQHGHGRQDARPHQAFAIRAAWALTLRAASATWSMSRRGPSSIVCPSHTASPQSRSFCGH